MVEACASEELSTIEQAMRTLRHEIDMLTKGGTFEVMVRNPNVSESISYWEQRAIKAEAERDELARERAKANELLDEGLEVFTNLIDSITRHGNYSPESTCSFIDQGAAAIREARRLADSVKGAG